MQTIEIAGESYTQIDKNTFHTVTGGEWIREERGDVVRKIRWAEREMRRWGKKLDNEDAAHCYMEALEIRNEANGDLEIIDTLWPRV